MSERCSRHFQPFKEPSPSQVKVYHFCTLVLMLAPPPIVVVPLPTLYPTACLYVLVAGITVSVRVRASRGCVYGVKEVRKVYDYFLTLKQEVSASWNPLHSIRTSPFEDFLCMVMSTINRARPVLHQSLPHFYRPTAYALWSA